MGASGQILELLAVIAGVGAAAAGLALLGWALFRDRARGRRRCPRCWYSMDGLAGLTCPECGRTARSPRQLGRTRRRWRRAAAGLAIAGLGATLALAPAVRRHGLETLVPTTALVGVLPWLDHDDAQRLLTVRQEGGMWLWQQRWLASSSIAMLDSEDADRRRAGAELLYLLAPRATPPPEVLAPRLTDPDADTRVLLNHVLRRSAAARVKRTGSVDAEAAALVRDAAIADSDPLIGRSIGETLGYFGPAGLPALVEILRQEDADVRIRALWGLSRLAESNEGAVNALLEAMQDSDPDVRRQAASAARPSARPESLPVLIEALDELAHDRDWRVRAAAANRWRQLRQEAALPAEPSGEDGSPP